jgi:UDP-N-acetyl-D-mannosaminuronic acid dehydrogenase
VPGPSTEPPRNVPFDEIVIVGCGVVGLPLGVALAVRGQRVLGIDNNVARASALRGGVEGSADPELKVALHEALARNVLRFATALEASTGRRAYVIAVPTPAVDGQLDASALDAAVSQVATVVRDGDLIMVRSTVPIGTARRVAARVHETAGRTVVVAATPDRSLTGRSYTDQFDVPHIVGGVSPEATGLATQVLQPLGQVVDTGSAETAEAIKLFANVQRDVTFALANELAMICDALGLDFHRIRRLGSLNYERFSVARPGPVGGPCLTKDVHLLAASLAPGQPSPRLSLAGRAANAAVVDHIASLAEAALDRVAAATPVLTVLGLAFKGFPATSEQRGSFALSLIERVQAGRPHVSIRRWDPETTSAAESLDAVASGSHVVVLATEHHTLQNANLALIGRCMAQPGLIIDLWSDSRVLPALPAGIAYHAFGAGGAAIRHPHDTKG